jgi:tyrosyl-tRNA synthetase
MKLSEELVWRGFHAETTVTDLSNLDGAERRFYLGADPSADSMTIGNLAAIMMAKCFMRHGYKPNFLVGGATGQIGDPKDNGERDLKSLDEVENNKARLAKQFSSLVGEDVKVFDNNDWFKDIKFLPFLREVGKQFSMTQLLDREFVKNRIGEGGSGISYAEFSYSLIQGYDFLHLYRSEGIDLQLCGADQYGNCVSGLHLIGRLAGGQADVYSTPLVIDPVSGRKFGKSEGNAVWLAADRTSVFDFYQFWLNQPDESAEYLLKIYTLVEPEELGELMERHGKNPAERLAQKRLAYDVTEIVHGEEEAKKVVKEVEVFGRVKEVLDGKRDVNTLTITEVEKVLEKAVESVEGRRALDEIMVDGGLASSKGEAKRLVESGAISVWVFNGYFGKVNDPKLMIGHSIVKKGKNKFILAR